MQQMFVQRKDATTMARGTDMKQSRKRKKKEERRKKKEEIRKKKKKNEPTAVI